MLLVDDEAMLVQSLEMRIRYLGIPAVGDIFTARSGEEALRVLEREEIGVMIVDMIMGGMSGLDLIRSAIDAGFACQFIVLSGHDDYILIRESFKAGTLDYLLKPVSNNDLLLALRKAVKIAEDRVIDGYAMSRGTAFAVLGALDGLPYPAWREQVEPLVGVAEGCACQIACAVCEERVFRELLSRLLPIMEGRRWTYCSRRGAYVLFFLWEGCEPWPFLSAKDLPDGVDRFALSPCVSTWEGAYAAIRDTYDVASVPALFPKPVALYYAPDDRSAEPLIAREALNALYGADASRAHGLIRGMVGEALTPAVMRKTSVEALDAFYNQILNRLEMTAPIPDRRPIRDFADAAEMAGYILRLSDKALAAVFGPNDADAVSAALEYIAMHFGEDIDMRNLARSLNINYTYFSELFKRQTGENFSMRLTRTRMEHAKTLLANPALRVQDIGRQVGYDSAKHFARAFKKHTGMTPSEYRDQ